MAQPTAPLSSSAAGALAIPPTAIQPAGGGRIDDSSTPGPLSVATAAETKEARGAAGVNAAQYNCCAAAAGEVGAEVTSTDVPRPTEQPGCCILGPLEEWNARMEQLDVEHMLHLFAGRPRLGSLSDAAEHLRMTVDQFDLMHGGSQNDMAKLESQQAILDAVRAGKYSIVWIGTPCSSFSLWWLDASMKQLRSREQPM